MAISSLGVGSGLDLETLLSNLMTVEQRPLQMLAAKQNSYQTKLSGYSMVQSALSSFKSAVSGLSSISQYQKTTAGSTNTDIATITSSGTAANGTYSLKVSQLAQSQKLVAAGVADQKAVVGEGTITIDFGKIAGGTYDPDTGKYTDATFESGSKGLKTIEITDGNNTLAGIRDAINAAGIGVTASIVNDGSGMPYRLALTSDATGEEQSMKISVAGDQALSDLLAYDPADNAGQNLQQTAAAQNAEFTLDGIRITKPSNSVSDAVEGVTIKLLSADPDKTTTLTVNRDTGAARTAVESLVKAYNDLNTTLKDLTKYNAEEKTASVLTGDSAVRSIQTAMKNMLSTVIAGGEQGYRTLSDVGIAVDKEGVLQIDSSKLGTAIEKNFDAFAAMFAEGGMSSNPAISFESAENYAKTGSFEVDITQVATKGTFAFELGAQGVNLETVSSADRTMQVTVNGVTKPITLDDTNYKTPKELAAAIQSKINTAFKETGASVVAEVDDAGNFTISSSKYGSGSDVKIAETGGLFTNKVDTTGLDVAGTINGQAATGNGQSLTGAAGTVAYGIKLKVTGEESGIKGMVSFTQGFAYQFSKVAGSLLGEGSAIQSRIDGMNKSIEQVEKDFTTYEKRIAVTEEMYRKKFTSLDMLIAQMNSTSDYLVGQLSALANLWNQNKK